MTPRDDIPASATEGGANLKSEIEAHAVTWDALQASNERLKRAESLIAECRALQEQDGATEGTILHYIHWLRSQLENETEETRLAEARIEALTAALRPFANFVNRSSFARISDDFQMTSGSPITTPQITAGDLRRAASALSRPAYRPQDGEGV